MSRQESGKEGRKWHSSGREQHGKTVEGGTASWKTGEKSERRHRWKPTQEKPQEAPLGPSYPLPVFPREPAPAWPPTLRTLSPCPRPAGAQLPTSPGLAASPTHLLTLPRHGGLPSLPPAHGGIKPSMRGGWSRQVASHVTQPTRSPIKA